MNTLDVAVDGLIGIIQSTEEYKDYQATKEKICEWPELKKKIDEFRIRNFEIQQMTDDKQLFEEVEKFEQEYETFREDSRVHDFLKKELAFCRMMQEVNYKITESLEFD